MWTYERVYVIQCYDSTFYVGSTLREMHDRWEEHRQGYGSRWTAHHGVKRVLCCTLVEKGTSGTLEDELTRYLMRKYGWGRVRGGKWVFLKCRSRWWLPKEFRDLGPRDVLPLHGGAVSHFSPELLRLIDAFEAACRLQDPNHLDADSFPKPVLGGVADHLHHVPPTEPLSVPLSAK